VVIQRVQLAPKMISMQLRLMIVACALIGATAAASASPYVVTLEEVGSNVVAKGSGAIDTAGLSSGAPLATNSVIIPTLGTIIMGTSAQTTLLRGPIVGPADFGSGGQTLPGVDGGPAIGLIFNLAEIVLPADYKNNSTLTNSAIYDTATFTSLGVTPGTYVWTWGAGADQSFTIQVGANATSRRPAR
jgi:hypothetical protein